MVNWNNSRLSSRPPSPGPWPPYPRIQWGLASASRSLVIRNDPENRGSGHILTEIFLLIYYLAGWVLIGHFRTGHLPPNGFLTRNFLTRRNSYEPFLRTWSYNPDLLAVFSNGYICLQTTGSIQLTGPGFWESFRWPNNVFFFSWIKISQSIPVTVNPTFFIVKKNPSESLLSLHSIFSVPRHGYGG